MKLITTCNDTVSVGKFSKETSSLPDVSSEYLQDGMRCENRSYMDRFLLFSSAFDI